ncbi:MAG: leucine-rich repeat domain-containing protein, partial [Christensenellales bacterium]
GIVSIGKSAFRGCTGLQDILLPYGVTDIGESALSGCVNLESISIPKSVTSIGRGAFNNCDALTTVYFRGTEEEWNGITINYADNTALINANKVYNND